MHYYIIPARMGSKGVPLKNRLLFKYTADILTFSQRVCTIVTTDDPEIKDQSLDLDLKVITRPFDLATDTANIKEVLRHVVLECQLNAEDSFTMLYLTYPHRTAADLLKFMKFFQSGIHRSMLCRQPVKTHPYLVIDSQGRKIFEHDLYRRQDYPEFFEISHFLFASYVSELESLNSNLYRPDMGFFDIDRVLDIDLPSDLKQV